MTPKTNNTIACGECDALQREVLLPDHGLAQCVRCGAELYRYKHGSLDHTLAFVLAAAVVFALANAYPLMGLDAKGAIHTEATLLDSAWRLAEAGMTSVALLVLATVIVFPALHLGAMLYMLVPLKLGVIPPRIYLAYRLVNWTEPWGMVEVFLVGALISLVRLTQVAKVDPGIGIYAAGVYMMLLAAAVAAFEPRALWSRVRELGEPLPALQEGAFR